MGETLPEWNFVAAWAIALYIFLEVALRPRHWKQAGGWRGEAMTWAAIFGGLACIALVIRLAAPVFTAMPSEAQAVVVSRASLLIFLFWLVIFAVPGLTGAWALGASFAILGWVHRYPSPVIPIPQPFVEEFWVLVGARERLSGGRRVMIWLRHALFGAVLLLLCGVGMLMTFGLPKQALWPYLAATAVLVVLLNPRRSDTRAAARLASAHPVE